MINAESPGESMATIIAIAHRSRTATVDIAGVVVILTKAAKEMFLLATITVDLMIAADSTRNGTERSLPDMLENQTHITHITPIQATRGSLKRHIIFQIASLGRIIKNQISGLLGKKKRLTPTTTVHLRTQSTSSHFLRMTFPSLLSRNISPHTGVARLHPRLL